MADEGRDKSKLGGLGAGSYAVQLTSDSDSIPQR